jgi:hypothetical protein
MSRKRLDTGLKKTVRSLEGDALLIVLAAIEDRLPVGPVIDLSGFVATSFKEIVLMCAAAHACGWPGQSEILARCYQAWMLGLIAPFPTGNAQDSVAGGAQKS